MVLAHPERPTDHGGNSIIFELYVAVHYGIAELIRAVLGPSALNLEVAVDRTGCQHDGANRYRAAFSSRAGPSGIHNLRSKSGCARRILVCR